MKKTQILTSIIVLLGLINIGLIYYCFNYCCLGSNQCSSRAKENAAEIRGRIVFHTYCVLCHGENADGKGRLAVGKVPPPANLTKSLLNDEQIRTIIRVGGASIGRSEFMPPWGDELNEGQINDLVEYINALKTK